MLTRNARIVPVCCSPHHPIPLGVSTSAIGASATLKRSSLVSASRLISDVCEGAQLYRRCSHKQHEHLRDRGHLQALTPSGCSPRGERQVVGRYPSHPTRL